MIQYIIEVLAFQLLFLGVYDLFLKKETFFNWNRAYLVGTSLISLVIPVIEFSAISTAIPEQYTYVFPVFEPLNEVILTNEAQGFTYQFQWMHIVYLGMLLSFVILLLKLFKIHKLVRRGKTTRLENYTKVLLTKSKQAFSFFRFIFLGDAIATTEASQIIEHELVHVKQKHSIDLLYFEILRVVFWFNPLVYVYQNRMVALHEFIADAHAVKTNKKAYVNELLSQAFQTQHISFVNQFLNPSLLTKRLKMINCQQSKSIFKLKYLFLVPLVFGMLIYNSCERLDEDGANQEIDSELKSVNTDQNLINSIKAKYEKMNFETLSKIKYSEQASYTSPLSDQLLNRYDFYDTRIRNLIFMQKRLYDRNSKMLKHFDERSIELANYVYKSGFANLSYDTYVSEYNFYRVFDRNIDLSLSGYSKALIDNIAKVQNKTTKVIKVNNVSDFTGEELTSINRTLESFVKADINNSLIVTDGNKHGQFFVNPNYDDVKSFLQSLKSVNGNVKRDSAPFSVVDEVPIFPGCENATDKRACFQEKIQEHIRKNFRYPAEAQAANIQGRVYTNFVIGTDGVIRNLRMRGPDKLLELEVSRMINILPKMIPGKHQGQPINVPFSIPVTFKLNDGSTSSTDKTSLSNNQLANLERMNVKEAMGLLQEKVIPFAVIEESPMFPGCENADDQKACFSQKMQEHVMKYFEYPKKLQQEAVEGKVYVYFHISKKGEIKNLRLRGPDQRLEEAVKKIIHKLPQFGPGRHKGKSVPVSFSIPITYKLH